MRSNGMYAEKLFREIAKKCGFSLEVPPSLEKNLYSYAESSAKRIERINEKRKENKKPPLTFLKVDDILDHLLKIDIPLTSGKETIGLQLTLQDPVGYEFKQKVSTVRNFNPTCQKLGFKWTTIVHITLSSGNETESLICRSDQEKEKLEDSFYDLIDNIIDQYENNIDGTAVPKPLFFTI